MILDKYFDNLIHQFLEVDFVPYDFWSNIKPSGPQQRWIRMGGIHVNKIFLNQYNNANPSYTVLIYITLCCHYCILLSWNRSVIACTSSLVLVHTLHFFPRLFALYLNKHSKGLLIALFSKILKCRLFSLRSISYVHM